MNTLKSVLFRLIRVIVRPFFGRGIWLISDRPDVGGDNGTAFFKYMKDKPEKTVFAIKKTAPDYNDLSRCGRVIEHSSLKYKILLCTADVHISSHNTHMMNHRETPQIFLGHGVCMNDFHTYFNEVQHDNYYVSAATNEEYGRFTSDRYYTDSNHVWLTGLPRFDFLENAPEKKIAVSLTWRYYECSKTAEDFVQSTYYRALSEILSDSSFISELADYGYSLMFLPHPLTRTLLGNTDFEKVEKVKDYGKMLRECSLMVSDYSSVVCDFAMMNKPVIFYQFDSDEFFSHGWVNKDFDYENQGFGPVVKNYGDLKAAIMNYVKNGCITESIYRLRTEKYIVYHDRNNCKRLYEKIKEILA